MVRLNYDMMFQSYKQEFIKKSIRSLTAKISLDFSTIYNLFGEEACWKLSADIFKWHAGIDNEVRGLRTFSISSFKHVTNRGSYIGGNDRFPENDVGLIYMDMRKVHDYYKRQYQPCQKLRLVEASLDIL